MKSFRNEKIFKNLPDLEKNGGNFIKSSENGPKTQWAYFDYHVDKKKFLIKFFSIFFSSSKQIKANLKCIMNVFEKK